jgi:hypothetical protein
MSSSMTSKELSQLRLEAYRLAKEVLTNRGSKAGLNEIREEASKIANFAETGKP